MKIFDKIALYVFLGEVPLLILFIVSCQWLALPQLEASNAAAKALYDFGGFVVFGSWAFLAIYFSSKMLLQPSFRKVVLAKITFMRERDEREIFLTGQAAKHTMLTTLAILIFLFCLSCFTFSYDEKSHEASWGIGFELTSSNDIANTETNYSTHADGRYSYDGLPVSMQTILAGLIGWQIFSYNYYMKHRE
jgi:hypothetical protein